jgi:tRNA(fMet)-specific endonuclease VapC
VYVLDTDILSLFQVGHDAVVRRVLGASADELSITVITAEETLSGWYTLVRRAKDNRRLALAYEHLAKAVVMLGTFRILTLTEAAAAKADGWQRLKLGVTKLDLRIAAIALEHQAVLVTRNRRDFERVPGLQLQNWADD